MITTAARDKIWVLIPFYNQSHEILSSLIKEIPHSLDRIVIVDDGSSPSYECPVPAIRGIRCPLNRGKGAAISTGAEFIIASACGADAYIVTADADGQHKASDIQKIIETCTSCPRGEILFIGCRNFKSCDVPLASRIGKLFSNILLRLESGVKISDTQSGLRAYPINIFKKFKTASARFDFETEILLFSLREGYKISEVEIDAVYPKERISHFRKIADTARIILLHFRLLVNIHRKDGVR
jgi:glycosyltransferase involved in cell wall biosynthesis